MKSGGWYAFFKEFLYTVCHTLISVPIQSLGWTVKNKIQTDWKIRSLVCEPFIPLRFFQLPLTPNRLSATLNNSLTVRAGLAHQLTDKYLKRKAVRWEQSALFTSQANMPLVCDGAWSCGALGLGGGWEGCGCSNRLYSCAHLFPSPDSKEDTCGVSDPPAHPGDANVTSARRCSSRWDFSSTLKLIPPQARVKSQWGGHESNRLNMMLSLLSRDYKVSYSYSRHRGQK